MKKIEIFGFVLMIFALISAVCVIADEYDYDFTYGTIMPSKPHDKGGLSQLKIIYKYIH